MGADRSRPVIVGSLTDPHVEAVARRLSDPLMVDVVALAGGSNAISEGFLMEREQKGWVAVRHLRRGWIRRLAPAGWALGTEAHTRRAAEQAAWLAMLISFLRVGGVEWLTPIDRLVAGENKGLLAEAAKSAGIASPRTVVACSPKAAAEILSTEHLVVKSLGPASYLSKKQGNFHVSIPTTEVSDWIDTPVLPEPYIYQERIEAVRHLRVVTVGSRGWCFSRPVERDEPLDWRYQDSAHAGFRHETSDGVEEAAIAIAEQLGVGHSSQDWIDDGDTMWVIDVNPSGQWLFLGEGADHIAEALSSWLREDGE